MSPPGRAGASNAKGAQAVQAPALETGSGDGARYFYTCARPGRGEDEKTRDEKIAEATVHRDQLSSSTPAGGNEPVKYPNS